MDLSIIKEVTLTIKIHKCVTTIPIILLKKIMATITIIISEIKETTINITINRMDTFWDNQQIEGMTIMLIILVLTAFFLVP